MSEDWSLPTASDADETNPGYPHWDGIAPLPNQRMMFHVGAPSTENFLVVGDAWGQLVAMELTSGARVLDIGCGCGRTARTLLHNPHISEYVGIDVILPYIDWNTRYLSPLTGGRFRFAHLDVHSAHYNPEGILAPDAAEFPLADASMTLAFAASLFTHLEEAAAKRYLDESRRVLRGGGKLIVSIHIEPNDGTDYQGNESRADVNPVYFAAMASAAGFAVGRRIGDVCGQETWLLLAT